MKRKEIGKTEFHAAGEEQLYSDVLELKSGEL